MVVMTCCGARFETVRDSMDHECQNTIVNAVARAISKAIEDDGQQHSQFLSDQQGNLLHGGDGALYILGDDGMMRNAPNGLTSEFTIILSDGSEFAVRVTPKHG